MRILYITHTFYPETLAIERSLGEALVLRDLGHEITILTAMPSYPLGRVFDDYRGRLFLRERIQGLEVIRVRAFSAPNTGVIMRLLSYASFSLAAMTVGLFLCRRELVIAAIPSPGTELAGIVVSRLKRSRLLLELIDVLPENLALLGVSGKSMLGKWMSAYYSMAYRLADWIAVLCPAAGEVVAEMGIEPDRILLLPNGVDSVIRESTPPEQFRLCHGLNGKFVVVYAGSFSPYYQVPQIIVAARLLRPTHPHIHFLLLGNGGEWSEVDQMVRAESLNNVHLTGIVPREHVGSYLQAADLFIFSMIGDPMPRSYHGILTAKACEYLSVGRPIVSVEDGSILAGLLERIGAGVHVEPGNSVALAEAIVSYASDPVRCRRAGDAARNYAEHTLPRHKVVQEFEQSLKQRMAEASTEQSREY